MNKREQEIFKQMQQTIDLNSRLVMDLVEQNRKLRLRITKIKNGSK